MAFRDGGDLPSLAKTETIGGLRIPSKHPLGREIPILPSNSTVIQEPLLMPSHLTILIILLSTTWSTCYVDIPTKEWAEGSGYAFPKTTLANTSLPILSFNSMASSIVKEIDKMLMFCC